VSGALAGLRTGHGALDDALEDLALRLLIVLQQEG
jgi:hypothetical protein